MAQSSLSLPANILFELEQWGKTTSDLFQRLRAKSGTVPPETPSDQTWFWSKEWQASEQQVDLEIANGQVDVFGSIEELFTDLNA